MSVGAVRPHSWRGWAPSALTRGVAGASSAPHSWRGWERRPIPPVAGNAVRPHPWLKAQQPVDYDGSGTPRTGSSLDGPLRSSHGGRSESGSR